MVLTAVSDEVLFEKIRQGDMAAFDVLYARYKNRLFSFILRYLKRHEEAEEIFHETFMSVLESKKIVFDRANFSTWLYQIARNKALNRLRARRQEARVVDSGLAQPSKLHQAELHQAELQSDEAYNRIEQGQIGQALSLAIQQLSEPLAEVYHLRSSGMSYEAMALILEVPLGTIKSRLHETVAQLRKEMKKWIAE